METFNDQIKDEAWLANLYEADPRAFETEYFMLGGASLRDEVLCMANDECKLGINVGKGEDGEIKNESGRTTVGPISYSWVFCFSCNRIFHLACQGLRSSEFKEIKLVTPYRCNECEENPLNEFAKDFFTKRHEIDQSMKKRREYFTKVFIDLSKTVVDKNQSEDDDVRSIDSSDKHNEEIKNLARRCENLEKKNFELMDEMKRCYEKMNDFVKLKAEVSELRQQAFESKHERCIPSNSRETQKLRFSSSTLFSPTHIADLSDDLMRDPLPSNIRPTVPVPKRKSLIENIDLNNLSRSELITLEQAQAQIEATEAQRDIAFTQNLTAIRKALPRIIKFNGDSKKWIQFKRDVDRHKTVGKYADYEMRIFILQALEGIALSRVEGMIDKIPYEETMKALQKCFGDPMRIIEKCAKDILSIKVPKDLYKDDVLKITSKIQEYKAACQYAEVEIQNSNHLGMHIFEQLGLLHKIMFRHKYREDNNGAECRLIDLDNLYWFLESLVGDLEGKRIDDKKIDDKKPKDFQVNVTSLNTKPAWNDSFKPPNNSFNAIRNRDDYMYVIRDKSESTLGYDMKALALVNKCCVCCSNSDHFTVQCHKYKTMSASDKLQLVNEKNLCRNCLVTTSHRAFNCMLKDRCGFRDYNNTCVLKHHITLHRALSDNSNRSLKTNNSNGGSNSGSGGHRNSRFHRPGKKGNSNSNQRKAQDIVDNNSKEKDGQRDAEEPIASPPDISVDVIISQAPTISEMPDSQVAFMNRQPKPATVANTASSNSNVNNMENSQPKPFLVESLGANELKSTVKVFKNYFLGPKGNFIHYSLGDSAAEITLVKEELREILGIEGEACKIALQWTDGSVKSVKAVKIDIALLGLASHCKEVVLKNCYAVPDLNLPPRSLNIDHIKERFPYLRQVEYESYEDISPSMLIGSPHASVFESMDKLIEDGVGKPVGLRALLGWTVYGGCPEECCEFPKNVSSLNVCDSDNLEGPITNEMLLEWYSYFNSIESLGITQKSTNYTEIEQKALDLLAKGMIRLDNGSIEVPLIWNCINDSIPRLPNNFAMVFKRQVAHERVLARNPVHLKAFNDNFKELLSEGYVRPANSLDLQGDWPNISYVPMSLIKNSNKDPPKFRNVFDASARFHGMSLNDNLLKGPDLLVDIIKPLLRMRENQIAFTADIKSMFMRIKINSRDQQVQRVLWRPDPSKEFQVFVFSSMLFGPKSSPFTSQFVKNATAESWKEKYPDAAEAIIQSMYMDDLLTSESSVAKATSIAKQCIEIFDSINWKLISFQSNSAEFLKSLPVSNVIQDTIPFLESENGSCVTKVLGCMWDTKNDAFIFKFDKNLFIKIVKDCQHRPTKRDQCSTIARIFDVLGLISHFTIRGKMLIQRSFLKELDWDDKVGEKEHKDWIEWLNEIEKVSKLKIPRRFNPVCNLSECDSVELHTFADAGGEAFAAVCYIVTVVNNERFSNIVMAKSKITPLRHKSRTQISEMPRLELCACFIGAMLADTVVNHFTHIKFKKYYWTDSEVVLRWLVKPNHRLLKYAASPVDEILKTSERNEWRYVPSKLNVADLATKFRKLDFSDSESVWFTGPHFLRQSEDHWPRMPLLNEPPVVSEPLMINVLNLKSPLELSAPKLPPLKCPLMSDCLVDQFRAAVKSVWTKLVRSTARALKIMMYGFIPLIRSRKFNDKNKRIEIKAFNESFEFMDDCDLERARNFLVRKAQREYYSREYKCLIANREVHNLEMKQLDVFLDSEGLIRINARVDLSYEMYPQKFAPMLPRQHWITMLFLQHVHEKFEHIHLETQVAYARSLYWIPQVRVALQSIQDNCNLCSFKKAKAHSPKMAPLPEFRTNPSHLAFETTGLDCMGPFVILNYNRPKKVWVLIFACTLTRFIHLRILHSLESIKVLEAIVEFWTTLGPIKTLISDRGTNFVGAKNVLEEDKKRTLNFLSEQNKVLKPQLAEKYNVNWKLLPAHSPWMGGVYERLIKEVKRSVAHVLNNKKLNATSFNIALQDAAHRINNRPLTHNAVSADDAVILTPHLLAKGRTGWPYLPGIEKTHVVNGADDRSVYRRGRAVADEITRRFFHFYLPVLTKRVKWFRDEKPIKAGDLVLLIEPNDTRKEWRRARVVKVYKGKDGRSRVADVIMPDKSIKKSRSIKRLAKIDIKSNH